MSRYLIGIDLGTTNTVMAFADRQRGELIELFDVVQLVALGEVAPRPQLPSLRYHPGSGELKATDLILPWQQVDPAGVDNVVIGSLAQELGAQVPGHLVASAKSWLSHRAVDRTAAILPWGQSSRCHGCHRCWPAPVTSPTCARPGTTPIRAIHWNGRRWCSPFPPRSMRAPVP